MARKPKTAEQIFLDNVAVRIVENHLLRRKVRAICRVTSAHEKWNKTLEKLDNRIELLTRQADKHQLQGASDV